MNAEEVRIELTVSMPGQRKCHAGYFNSQESLPNGAVDPSLKLREPAPRTPTSGGSSLSCGHRTKPAQNHHRTQSGVYLLFMPRFNVERDATNGDPTALALRKRHDERHKAQNQNDQANEE
jgi:hypothetical protein